MSARFVPDILTRLTADEAVAALDAAYLEVFGEPASDEALALLTAQTALETGRWKSMHCWNWGNAKVGTNYDGLYTTFRCNEVINGKLVWFDPPHIQTHFRAYDSAADGAVEHVRFLAQRKRYARAWDQIIAGNPAAYSKALKLAGYYTASETLYTAAVVRLFKEFLGAVQRLRDKPPDTDPAQAVVEPDMDEHSAMSNTDLVSSLAFILDVDLPELRAARDQFIRDRG